ncbi:MAG: vWA domain-containing protein [Candidatus Hodarchaeales archaeon]|jgi:Ca-activated chloride channel family protein
MTNEKKILNNVKIGVSPSSEYALESGETHLYAQLELEALEEIVETEERTALNLSVVLDRSGSMGGSKIEKAKKAVEFIIENLSKSDIFSLVIYDDVIETIIPANKISEKTSILAKVRSITARNMTDLHDGMMEGVKQVRLNTKLEYRNVVLLLSDGLANVGITAKDQVAKSAKDVQDKHGITISTFGIGDDFDEDMLISIADAASGEFYYIKSADDIPAFIEKEFKGLLATIASNIQVRVEPAEGVRIQRILGMSLADQNLQPLKLGDLRAGNNRLIILDIMLPSGKLDSHQDIVNFRVEWIPSQSGLEKVSQQYSCSVTFTNKDELLASENQKVLDNVVILETALIREEALHLADKGQFSDAQKLVTTQQSKLRYRANLSGASPKLESVFEENEALLSDTLSDKMYTRSSRKFASDRMYSLRKQRKK